MSTDPNVHRNHPHAWLPDSPIWEMADEIERLRAELGELVQPSAYATGLVLQRLTEGRVRIVPAAEGTDDEQ